MIRFSEAERAAVQHAALRVWQEIGYDCLIDMGADAALSRSAVVDVVLDADRLLTTLRRANPELADKIGDASHSRVRRMVLAAFPLQRYGL